MKNLSKSVPVILFMMALLATAVACGPAAPTTSEEGSSAAEEIAAIDKTLAGANAATADSSDAISIAEEEESSVPAGGSSAAEVDANGIEVGFTSDGRPYRGNLEASVVIEEFSDYQCPFCGRFTNQTFPTLAENQVANGEVVFIFHDFPLANHPQAVAAANAARCAGEQGAAAYWAMHDRLFENAGEWSNSRANAVFTGYAQELGLDTDSFSTCVESNKYEEAIQADLAYGRSRNVSSTPTFFINEQPLIGAQPLATFNDAIATVNEGGDLPAAGGPSQPAVAPTPATIATNNAAYAYGDPEAPVTIVEYTDYQCPYCRRYAQETLPQIKSELIDTGQVYYIFKDFPLEDLHPQAPAAAVAARCAGEQGAYIEMHDALFNNLEQWQGQVGNAANGVFTELATGLKLDTDSFSACLESGRFDALIQNNLQEGLGLGVGGTPTFFIDGFPVRGAQPYDLFAYAVDLAQKGTLADAYVPQATPTPRPTPSGPVDVPIADAYGIGDPDAPVIIVEYTDYQCPYCGRHAQQTFPQIKEQYIDTGQVYYVFKDFPLTSIHPQAVEAAEAARCAGEQEAFAAMHDLLFGGQQEWNGRDDAAAIFTTYAGQLDLDTTAFSDCLASDKYHEAIGADLEEGIGFGIQGTPGFFINGRFLSGAQPFANFQQAIESTLAEN